MNFISKKISSVIETSHGGCFHCGLTVPRYFDLSIVIENEKQPVCCYGCKAAAEFIQANGMADFYQYRGAGLPAVPAIASLNNTIDEQWLSFDQSEVASRYLDVLSGSGNKANSDDCEKVSATIYVQGMYCSSCGWLIEKALSQLADSLFIQLNIDTHYLKLTWDQTELNFSQILDTIVRLGYQPRPIERGQVIGLQAELRNLDNHSSLKRLVVAGLGMMQVMTYAVALYLGDYQGIDEDLRRFLTLVSMLVSTVVVFYAGRPFFSHAWFDLKNRQLGMDVPVALAIGSAYAFSAYDVLFRQGHSVYFDSAVMFVFFLSLGRHLEMRARYQAASSADAMLQLLPPVVTVYRRLKETENMDKHKQKTSDIRQRIIIEPQKIALGDQLRLRSGETLACDGIIQSGSAYIDQSVLNGETTPVLRKEGDVVIAGSVVCSLVNNDALKINASSDWQNSTIAAVNRLFDDAQTQQAKPSGFMALVTRYFVAFILTLTVVVGAFWWFYAPERLFEIVLAMLIASCPCAFSLAAPVVMTVSSQSLRRKGVLLANFDVLNKLSDVTHWCFDKTGTLTRGQVSIEKVVLVGGKELDEQQCLQIIAAMERGSEHVLAPAFIKISTNIDAQNITVFDGLGLSAVINNEDYYVGKPSWVIAQAGLNKTSEGGNVWRSAEDDMKGAICVALAKKQALLAFVYLSDALRSDSKQVLSWLHDSNKELSILSGDGQIATQVLVQEIAVSAKAIGDLLPQQKSAYIKGLQQADSNKNSLVAMVGDGVNDAPVLATADVSIALASGSAISQSYADVVLLGGNLRGIELLHRIANKARLVIKQNMFWAVMYNLLVLPLAALGLLTPWLAAIGMSLSSLFVVINAQRLNRVRL